MDCRDFREKHVAFVDDTLAGIELVGMQCHIAECECCASQDAKVRRALLLFRNLPSIELSAGFAARLDARLKETRQNDLSALPAQGFRRGAIAAAIASAVMIGYIGTNLYDADRTSHVLMAPVVASTPDHDLTPITTPSPAIVASVSAGFAIWPAALFAEQAPVHFAHSRPGPLNYTR